MNIRIMGKRLRIDLHNRSKHDEMPVGSGLRYIIDQFNVETFIYHSEKSKSGMWNILLCNRIFLMQTCSTKMMFVYTAWERINVVMLIFFRFINTMPTCKYD